MAGFIAACLWFSGFFAGVAATAAFGLFRWKNMKLAGKTDEDFCMKYIGKMKTDNEKQEA